MLRILLQFCSMGDFQVQSVGITWSIKSAGCWVLVIYAVYVSFVLILSISCDAENHVPKGILTETFVPAWCMAESTYCNRLFMLRRQPGSQMGNFLNAGVV